MLQTVDPIKLTAAAEHLEWVLMQYQNEPVVQSLLQSLLPLIEDAKARRVKAAIDSSKVPSTYSSADGAFLPFKTPSVGDAYAKFKIELGGGLTDQDRKRHDQMEAFRQSLLDNSCE